MKHIKSGKTLAEDSEDFTDNILSVNVIPVKIIATSVEFLQFQGNG